MTALHLPREIMRPEQWIERSAQTMMKSNCWVTTVRCILANNLIGSEACYFKIKLTTGKCKNKNHESTEKQQNSLHGKLAALQKAIWKCFETELTAWIEEKTPLHSVDNMSETTV